MLESKVEGSRPVDQSVRVFQCRRLAESEASTVTSLQRSLHRSRSARNTAVTLKH